MKDSLLHIPPSRFEKFGLYYLNLFRRYHTGQNAFLLTDQELTRRVNRISLEGMILSAIVSVLCVFPIVYVDDRYEAAPWWIHYGWVALATVLATAVEFYFLFYISLRAVHKVSELIRMRDNEHETLKDGIFGVKNILARTALEINDPELKILGIDPFKKISRKNLFVLGLLYKAKIIVTNIVVKYGLKLTAGNWIFGIPVLYEAIPVEIFWNAVVIRRVIREARLRLFGYALANKIADTMKEEGYLQLLSPAAKKGCLRAIGNAVVMTKNYHPNMVILLLRFQDMLQISEEDRYDDWQLFLDTLGAVMEKERNFLLDLFTVAAAFDGKISDLEHEHFREAYQQDYPLYRQRLLDLTANLRDGKLNAALALCKLDFVKG